MLDIRSPVLGADSPDTANSTYGLAGVLALEGKRDEAFTNLPFAVDHAPNADMRKGLESDVDLKALHGDPRFAALLAAARQSAGAPQNLSPKN